MYIRSQTGTVKNNKELNNYLLDLLKPKKLNEGDKITTVSPSWGGAGDKDLLWRYEQGKKRLEDTFGLQVVEMENTLKGTDYIYAHPEKRAEDLMQAFSDKSINGIFACIGGIDSIRLLPYIDFEIITRNPKIFIGYSDSTIIHYMCLKAGVSSIYGPSVLVDFAENVTMPDYTVNWLKKTLFSTEIIGNIPQSEKWTSEFLPWEVGNKDIQRKFKVNNGYELLQGEGMVQGRLIGGCIEVMEFIKGTELFPKIDDFDGSILFFETSEEKPEPRFIEYWLRNYGAMGVLKRVNGIIFGKPQDETYYEEYKHAIIKVLAEYEREDLPVLYNLSFGHCEPKFCIPYGVMAQIDCEQKTFSILEPGVID